MEKKIIKDLYCFQCSLQFDKKTIYDMHLKIMHNYVSVKESILTKIKNEPEEINLPTNSINNSRTTSESYIHAIIETVRPRLHKILPRVAFFYFGTWTTLQSEKTNLSSDLAAQLSKQNTNICSYCAQSP